MKEALHDSRAMREFARVDLGEERASDESTILRFRHLMETHEFGGNCCAWSMPISRSRGWGSHGARWSRNFMATRNM